MNKRLLFLMLLFTVLLSTTIIDNQTLAQGKPKKPKDKKEHYEKKKGPPPWAPAHGYRKKTRYIYFPEQETYYDINRGVYIHYEGRNWEISAKIPLPLQNVNLDATKKVELSYSGEDVQLQFQIHKKKYPRG